MRRFLLLLIKTTITLATLLTSFFAQATPLIMPNQRALFLSNIQTVNEKAAKAASEDSPTTPTTNNNEDEDYDEEPDMPEDEEDKKDREDED